MNLKGDLDSIGLAELFQTLSTQRATGVLTVTGVFGEKVIAIAHGEIAVLSEKVGERVRLGDLLIARGKMTEGQLQEALKVQRTSEQRSRLGDVLVKLNIIKPQDIADSLKFQVEEEIYELFTWKGAAFEFNGDQSVEDAANQENAGTTLQRMFIEPQQLIAEASKRMSDWQQIETRLPTPYLCFKLTPKGEELISKAAPQTQAIIKLLKEGRTIETTVKKSCMGRFMVCKTIVKLLDDGWIFPFPAAELRYLASEHRAHGRFSDALYVYRRMMDAAQQDAERSELQGLIDDTLDAIRRAQDAGESVEGADTISFKEAAERFKRRSRIKRVALLAFSGAGLIAATMWLTQSLRPPPGIAEAYQDAYQRAEDARRMRKFKDAVSIWRVFQSKLDSRSPTFTLVEEQIKELQIKDSEFINNLLVNLKELQKSNLNEAEKGYLELQKELTEKAPESKHLEDIAKELEAIKGIRQQQEAAHILANLKEHVAKARALFDQKKYTQSKNLCTEIARAAPAGSAEDEDAAALFKQLSEIEAKSMQLIEQGKSELQAQKGEKAISSYEAAALDWPDLQSAETGRREAQRLKIRLQQLREDITATDNAKNRGLFLAALERCQQIQRDYPEFELSLTMRESAAKLQAQIAALDVRIKDAQSLLNKGDKDKARKAFADLARENLNFLISRNVELPVSISSIPPGATIRIDDLEKGTAPKEFMIAAGKAATIRADMGGYETQERKIDRTGADDLEIILSLRREALQVLALKPAVLAQPRVIDKFLFLLNGSTLSAVEPNGKQILWTAEKLFDENVNTRPNPLGGAAIFIDDKTWWYPRYPPMPMPGGKVLLSLRSRELVEIDTNSHASKSILTLPVEPVGWPHIEYRSFLAGKTLIAVACADGKIRTYDADVKGSTLWEKPCDSGAAGVEGVPITGLAPRTGGSFVALSARGLLTCFNIVNGQENWKLPIKGQMSESCMLPETTHENLAALVHKDGKLTIVDLEQHEVVWELSVAQPMEEVISAIIGKDGIYVATRGGPIIKYSRDKANKPTVLWKRPLESHTEIPICLGKNVFAVSSFGTLYAISPKSGEELWRYKTQGAPLLLGAHAELMYLTMKDGRLLIMNADQ